jgi:GntR family transcriptional regulator, colanic acid and biofilm gene transcriptional regulator
MSDISTRSREAKVPSAARSRPPRLLERPATLAEGAYESIAASLMEGGYVPGEKIATRTLAAQLGVSLTPAREAVLRLVREGALELFNARATVVPTLSLDRFKEIYCIRHALEPKIAKEAADRLTGDDVRSLERSLERMTASYRRGDYRSAFRSDGEFHFRIYEAAGMPLVVSFIRAAWLRVGPTFRLLYPSLANPDDAIRIHAEAIVAVKARNGPGLASAIERDLLRGEDLLRRLLATEQVGRHNSLK